MDARGGRRREGAAPREPRQRQPGPACARVPARHYLVSTNGDIFHHPDDEAIARIVVDAPDGATVWFNYRTPRTERWDDVQLRAEHHYDVRYPTDDTSGVVLTLPARD